MNIKIEENAKKSLDLMKRKYKNDLVKVINGIKELREKGLESSGIKNIGDGIYRKRVGRWRILFTIDFLTMKIWIIKMEKDTKKDYDTWKKYILNKI
ncbi:MAG: hypothetical protein Q9M94_02145 [Candidatus Gracilibacteria bacterium]|nr:hypothetical protein [Candidatus Gracilibacteria bacterium]MDQ7023329.1 hypothetical protein [Candidatus Gracilibacteria bacterium]